MVLYHHPRPTSLLGCSYLVAYPVGSYCSKALSEYPLIMNDDAGLAVFHAACAAALATEIIVDLYTFFRPPAPYHQLFVLDPIGERAPGEGAHAVNGS